MVGLINTSTVPPTPFSRSKLKYLCHYGDIIVSSDLFPHPKILQIFFSPICKKDAYRCSLSRLKLSRAFSHEFLWYTLWEFYNAAGFLCNTKPWFSFLPQAISGHFLCWSGHLVWGRLFGHCPCFLESSKSHWPSSTQHLRVCPSWASSRFAILAHCWPSYIPFTSQRCPRMF